MEEPIPARLEIDVAEPGVIEVRGELDAHSVTWLQERVEAVTDEADLTLDVSGLDFIDSSGLRLLITQHQRLEAAGHRLLLRSPSAAVSRLLEMTDLTDHLNVV